MLEDIRLQSNRHTEYLSKKKVSKRITDVFSCFKEETVVEETEKVASGQPFLDDSKISGTQERKEKKKREWKRPELQKQFRRDLDYFLSLSSPTSKQIRRIRRLKIRLGMPVEYLVKKKKVFERKYERKPKRYDVYIKSHWWRDRRNKFLQDFGKFCKKCGDTKHTQVHHLRYASKEFGSESNSDLVALCEVCHKRFHDTYGVKKDCHEDFQIFMEKEYLPVVSYTTLI